VRIVGTGQQRFELDRLEVGLQRIQRGRELLRQLRIVVLGEELVDRDRVAEAALKGVEAIEGRVQACEVGRDPLPGRGLVPQRWVGGLRLQLCRARTFALDVKGTPGPRSRARRSP
jgi:hypothetical protein